MSSATQPTLAIDLLLAGTYRITRFIGKGGMGEVYEATHSRLSGRYAVKLLRKEVGAIEEAIRRFKQEAEITSRLRHPNIVQVIDFAQMDDGAAFMVMEFLEGHDLAEELRIKGPLPLPRVLDLANQIANGLAAAHAEGIVHRDLKPANIFLSPLRGSNRELAKIVDFGISKIRAATTGLTQTQTIIGTPQYMAPEQARGLTKSIDAHTDQFAFAVIVYEMLAGRPAFEGDGVASVLYQVVHEPAQSLVSLGRPVSPEIDAVIARGMSKNSADRYESVEAFTAALAEAAGRPVSVPSVTDDAAFRATAYLPGPAAFPNTLTPSNDLEANRSATQKPVASTTTFRDASGELAQLNDAEALVTQRVATRKKKLALFGAAGGVAVLGILAVLFSSSDITTQQAAAVAQAPGPAQFTAPAAPAPRPTAPTLISVEIDGSPPGLSVTVDGVATALPLELAAGSQKHRVVFSAPGFVPQQRMLGGQRDIAIELALKPVAKPLPERRKPASTVAREKPKPKRQSANVVTDL
ncbi:MAG: serine/threonine-protein kinase [Deltaproteobacteria bacterium]|nr:serine/threonine-protein kinase [Deltaproteobacteria bacterium]